VKTTLAIISALLIGYFFGVSNQDAEGAIDPREAVKLAYQMGKEEQNPEYIQNLMSLEKYELVRLTQSDINKLIGE